MSCPYAGRVELKKPENINTLMSGAVISNDGQLTIDRNLPVPSPKCTEVVIKVFAAGISSYDCQRMSDVKTSFSEKSHWIPGSDVTGFIHNLGRGVTKFAIGQPVYTVMAPGLNGGFAEYMAVPQQHVFPLNPALNFSQGATLGLPYFAAYKALFLSGNAEPTQSVLILGANDGVGSACCELAVAHGMTVIATANSPTGLDLPRSLGATALITSTDDHFCQKIKNFTEQKGVDLLIDTGAVEQDILNAVADVVSDGGTIVTVHGKENRPTIMEQSLQNEVHLKTVNVMDFTEDELSEIASAINAYVEKGDVRPYIGDEFPLRQITEAYATLQSPQSVNGHVIISMN